MGKPQPSDETRFTTIEALLREAADRPDASRVEAWFTRAGERLEALRGQAASQRVIDETLRIEAGFEAAVQLFRVALRQAQSGGGL